MKTQSTDKWRYRRTPQKTYHHEDEVGLYALIAAIVKQAVDDYRDAERMEKGEIRYVVGISNPSATKREVVLFFKSNWYATLCDIPHETILKYMGVKA